MPSCSVVLRRMPFRLYFVSSDRWHRRSFPPFCSRSRFQCGCSPYHRFSEGWGIPRKIVRRYWTGPCRIEGQSSHFPWWRNRFRIQEVLWWFHTVFLRKRNFALFLHRSLVGTFHTDFQVCGGYVDFPRTCLYQDIGEYGHCFSGFYDSLNLLQGFRKVSFAMENCMCPPVINRYCF